MIVNKNMHGPNVGTAIDSLELDANNSRELWQIFFYRGIAIFLFGFVSVAWPKITLVAMAYVFAISILIIGALDIVNGFRSVNSKNLWFLKVLLGVVEVGVGLYLLRSGFVVTTAIYLKTLGLILMLQAIIDLAVTIRSEHSKGLKVLSLFSSFLTFVIGVFLVRQPISSGLTFIWIVGLYGILVGSITIAAALSIRPAKS